MILQHRNNVYLIVPPAGARRWVNSTQKFSSQVYYRPNVIEEGTPVPSDHPAHAYITTHPEG